jgi:catechol 2,3-dioxygenase-like lactoylglutathione lyase family enzyme
VDHLVLRTDNAQSCIELFASTLGIRLALDRTVPEWGGRMLFFRAGKLTLEAIQSDDDTLKGNHFHGIAFQCQNIERTAEDLVERGVTLSDIREGRKPGTFVATVKSHCLGLPTLLIQPAK